MACCGGGTSLDKKLSWLQEESPLGAYLGADELLELAKLCVTSSFRPQSKLDESPFFIVMSGQVEVRDSSSGEVLCTKYPGAFFTRRAGLFLGKGGRESLSKGSADQSFTKKSPKSADSPTPPSVAASRSSIVKADDDILDVDDQVPVTTSVVGGRVGGRVLMLHMDQLDHFLQSVASPASVGVMNAVLRTNIGMQLSQVPFIQQARIDHAGLRALGEIAHYQNFEAGKKVFSQGDAAHWFYIILKGQVDITINARALRGAGEELIKAGSRGVGESFGVAALVYNAAERKYSATASEKTLCLVITKENFSKFLGQKPELEATLMRSTKRFLLQRYAAMNVPIFGHISAALLDKAAKLAAFQHFQRGDVIYRQGDPPKAFYVVLHGEVTMSTEQAKRPEAKAEGGEGGEGGVRASTEADALEHDANRVANSFLSRHAERTLTVGQHFGEVGVLLPQTPCIATCTAKTSCSLLVLDSAKFVDLFGQDRSLLAEMQIKLLRHGCTLRACLNHETTRPLFVKHIEGEYSGENIHFYDAVAHLLRQVKEAAAAGGGGADADADARKECARIVGEYIVDGSSEQVNIPGFLQKAIKDMNDAGDATALADLVGKLKDAQTEIYVLMARDNFPRFVKSEPFSAVLEELGSYDASVTQLVSESDLTMLVQDGEGASEEEGGLMSAHLNA